MSSESRSAATVDARLARRFADVGPWQSRFVVDGVAYGGALDYSTDQRVPMFFGWFGAPRTILELSSFEGAHSLQLAEPETSEHVLGLEGRSENVARARLAASILGRGNISFDVADLETVELASHGSFDAVFCCGLLYHLARPWRLLSEIATVSGQLFLDTHHWQEKDVVEVAGYAGGWFEEGGYGDPLSGLGRRSFWLTRAGLLDALAATGWDVRAEFECTGFDFGPRLWLECRRRGSESASGI